MPSAAQQEPDGWVQVFGEQLPPLLHVPEQFACVVSEQVPSAAQHAPVLGGATHGSGWQTPPFVHVPEIIAHVDSVETEHAFVKGAQQEPVGCAQIFGVQPPPLNHVPEQAACVVTEQEPSAAQHEPVGWAQGLGEHGVRVLNTHPVGQSVRLTFTQDPSTGEQHAPEHGEGASWQVSPLYQKMLVQSASVELVHCPPPSKPQHAPIGAGCAHKFGVQPPPLNHVPEQAACVVSEQEPSAAQHAPVAGGGGGGGAQLPQFPASVQV